MNETTVGARLAKCRKEQGLSQEALGEQLSVSRQSIYKWESDQSLPEIDKLITISKLFGVSVGWILGVEAHSDPTQSGSAELTETQLAMVEEITARYIAAQSAPEKRRRWPLVLAACVVVVGCSTLFNRLDQLDNQYHGLQSSVYLINDNVANQIYSITQKVEDLLKTQNNLTADYVTQYRSRDLLANTATFFVRAVPKTYIEGMEAIFLADDGTGPVEVPGTLGTGQEFSAELTCGLTDTISLSVVFRSGTQRETQLLDEYSGLYLASLPALEVMDYKIFLWPNLLQKVEDGYVYPISQESFPDYVTLIPPLGETLSDDPLKQGADIASIKVGVFKNQTLLGWGTPCDQPDNFHGDYTGQQFYQLPKLLIPVDQGDALCVAAVITDTYGRITISVDAQWSFDLTQEPPSAQAIDNPDSWRYAISIEDWTF